ncbi:helicase-like transcription factor CHR28 [Chenopodium quinoa]|uniref:helicase-like transcription factor CHR28 n=1 Tax=Chenopodium quinoa TaxID=63459 RepID=UPI000B797EE3|nr:helicase-like transcription factor CHR28 [Chenopodium quinoa]
MMMAAAGQQEGFNFGLMNNSFNDFSHGGAGGVVGGGGNDDDDFAIDADAFFSILDEDDNSDHLPFPVDPFYPSTDNTQESGSAILANDRMDVLTDYGAASENSADTVEALEQLPYSSPPEMVLSEANDTSFRKDITVANTSQLPTFVETESFPIAAQDWYSIYKMSSGFPDQNSLGGVNYDMMSTNLATRANVKSDLGDSRSSHPWSDTKIALEAQVGAGDVTVSEVRMYDFFDGKEPESVFYSNRPVQHVDTVNTFDNSSSSTTTDETSAEPFYWRQMDKSCLNQTAVTKDEVNDKILTSNGFECKPSEASKGPSSGFSFGSGSGKLLSSAEAQYSGFVAGDPAVKCHNLSSVGDIRKPRKVHPFDDPMYHADLFAKINSSYYNTGGEVAKVWPVTLKPNLLEGTLEASQTCLSEGRSDIDDGNDLCIIENMSEPARIHPYSVHGKSVIPHPTSFTSQCSTSITPFHQIVPSGTKSRASDERLIFQSLVQDLSQPKSEASAPEGSLAVPLLRHQRIALSWMVQKETNSLHCSGGILADDQGLGKTVSTIALILTERPVSAGTLKVKEQGEPETLDLDEDDDKKKGNSIMSSSVKGRPAAGTLVVCPTSVLRQWAEELANKVTSKANLSVYVYHGSNRTKDPYELAKYDVVLTTYSIVSMEVPKQPVVLKNGSDGRKSEVEDASSQFNRKRKQSSTSDKKRSKRGTDNSLVESVVHPLARVGWFRVVLDEAQSIKNHRTRVAQACWGLRAKRRWCLSGTPIQNAVDDLYSYFRFLKYDPYSVYNSFCSMVKFQISKNPTRGYQKLQAVLKNIMLRRTKGTLLDGKPIINLPPKSVKLKKVEFSEEEREFYSKLEADSRAQFQAYADSGTVKQNYVNILLMLLRLRQACDHPFLVKGYDSSSVLKSSIHTAKKLPRDRQMSLLSCLEASQAICGICRDPPEDAVVSICGHVFCNQCISERFTADDNVCPSASCKSELSASNVFSKGTLNSCLSDQDCQEGSHICPGAESSEQKELIQPGPPGRFESSKIKAALEVLNSLSKPHVSVPSDVPSQPVTDTSLLDKSNSAPFATYNEISSATNGLGNCNSVIKEKAIVFSQWTRMLDLLEDCLKESSIQYRRLDGTMSVAARDKAVRDFNTLPEVSVMIMSLKAASLGLNMVAACHVILLDLWWNPTTEDQAIDRAHRIGQTRPVTVVRLTVKDTVEDRILALQQKKRELVASAFGEDEKGSRQSRLTVEDLTYLFMA